MHARVFILLSAATVVALTSLPAQQVTLDSAVLSAYRWRNIGPDRGGRSIAVSGVRGRPDEAYFGATGGGLWKTVDGGENWHPVTDFKITSASVGAVAVSETNPDLVFIGTGESCIRGNIMPGDGVYRSRDGGETWEHLHFRESHAISKIRVHPTNPDIVFVASFGKYGAPSEERGLYKSTDGGDTWRQVLYRNDETGAVDISIDRNNPDVMFVALWEAYRKEYQMSSGGPGSGLFKSTDGGENWTEITRNPGLPQEGVVGRIGVSVSRANSNRVYALVEHDEGGLFSSDDGGDSWTLINNERRIRQRSFYYTHVFADNHDEDVVYIQNTTQFRSEDGGRTLESINNGTHGDFHDFWIDPDDAEHLVVGNDGGGAVSFNTGQNWTDQEFSTAQFYHVVTTAHVPFHVCGSQQDNSTLCTPYDWNASRFGFGQGGFRRGPQSSDITAGSTRLSYVAGGGEPGYIAPDPLDPDVFYSGTNNGRYLDKFNRRNNTHREVNPYPWFYSGEPAIDIRERWQWTFPIIFSPLDPQTLYVSSQRLWRTTDGGNNWTALSGDLTRADPMTLQHTGGPITGDMNGPEVYATIFAVAPSKTDINTIWVGSDDGLVHVTRDGGYTWNNITPPDMPDFGRVSQMDASAFSNSTVFMSVRRPLLNDLAPYIWRTDDYGATWTKIVDGIRGDAYVHTVREDPHRPGLLYAGTQHGVYVTYDNGDHWQELNPNLPDVPIADLIVEHNELVIGTHGRSFWVLDNLAPLRQMTPDLSGTPLKLFAPAVGYRSGPAMILSWWSRDKPTTATLEIIDAEGTVVRTMTPVDSITDDPTTRRYQGERLELKAGINHVAWNMRADGMETFPGMILWGVRVNAPALPPGTYTARLTADGRTDEVPLTIDRHPWIEGVTDADLQAQYAFSSRVMAKVNEANGAVIAIRDAKSQLETHLEDRDDRRLRRAAERFDEAASAVEANIYQVRNRSGQDPLNFPIKVNNRLANLMSMAESGDGRPMNNMAEIFGILSEELRGYLETLDQVWRNELADVNEALQRLGLDPICPTETACLIS